MNFSILTDPDSYSYCLYIIGFITLPVHIFGAYCILFQTPDTMKHVKWVLFILHFFNSWLDLTLSIFCQPFIIPPIFGGFFMGIFVKFGIDMKFQVYMIVTLIMLVAVSTISIFENRFFLLFAEFSWWRYGRRILYVLNYSLALLYFIPTILLIPDQDLARKETLDYYTDIAHFNTPEHLIYVVVTDSKIMVGIWHRQLISLAVVLVEGPGFVLLLHWKIWRSTKNMTISKNTLAMQKTFLRAIYMQIAIPLLVMGTPQAIMVFFGYINQLELSCLAYILMSIHGASATLIMLYFHAPYREFCWKLFCEKIKKVNVIPTGTTEAQF